PDQSNKGWDVIGKRRTEDGRARSPERKELVHAAVYPAAKNGGRVRLILFALALLAVSCRQDMYNQPKKKPLAESEFFKDGSSARPLPPHVVQRGNVHAEPTVFTGLTNGIYITQLPLKLRPEILLRGRERYDIYCATCHGLNGNGNGMIAQRGFPSPPSYHIKRLRDAPIGYFYDVMANGYGVMSSYASRVAPDDRWAIAAYIRALQLSHNAKLTDLTADQAANLQRTP
ncbi:MAG: hypothetical protein JWO45_2211, partial [Spartobacteria bacterium]|nr:hypothetical protein [Spartobacteria bacterium]